MPPIQPPELLKQGRADAITAADLSAVISGYAAIARILEQISERLESLKEIKSEGEEVTEKLSTAVSQFAACQELLKSINTEMALVRKRMETELVAELVKASIVEHELDIRNDKSKISIVLNTVSDKLTKIDTRVKWAIAVLALSVALIGGPRVIFSWLEYKKTEHANEIQVDFSGHAFVATASNDTLWLSRNKP
jgi:hypothetical protein